MRCSICNQEIIFLSKDDSMVMNDKTEGRAAHGKCYEDKFGVDALDDMCKTATPPSVD